MKKLIAIISLILFFQSYIFSQTPDQDEYFKNDFIRYEDFVYVPNIKTVELTRNGDEMSLPIIQLHSTEKLKLSFDDLETDIKNFSYTFVHCDADWKLSDIIQTQYLSGYNEDRISDYQTSFNTIQRYTHYYLIFPREEMIPLISGNYLLEVFPEGDQSHPVITAKFMITDPKIEIKTNIHRATVVEDRNSKQEIDFQLMLNGYKVDNPFGDLKIKVTQNYRNDKIISDLKPLFVKGDELDYNYEKENIFEGGNEFRNFEFRSLRYFSEHVEKIFRDTTGNHVNLFPDERRSYKHYTTDSDINGRYLIKRQEGSNSSIEADYAFVHFSLKYESPFVDGNVYVVGSFNNFQRLNENKMHYNPDEKEYECEIFLKQGYYNYEYTYLQDGKSSPDNSLIEGSHYETENDYLIFVYHRATGSRYDQLIAVKFANTLKIY